MKTISTKNLFEILPKKFTVGYFTPTDLYRIEASITRRRLKTIFANEYKYSGICIMVENTHYNETNSGNWLIN